MRRITLVIADRHPIVLQGISSVLATQHDFTIVASCGNGASCMEAVRLLTPDIVLLEVAMPDISGPEILALANSAGLGTRVVFFTSLAEDRELARLAAGGAHAVLSKDATRDAGGGLAAGCAGPETAFTPANQSGLESGASRSRGEVPDAVDGPGAADHAARLGGVNEQRDRPSPEHC